VSLDDLRNIHFYATLNRYIYGRKGLKMSLQCLENYLELTNTPTGDLWIPEGKLVKSVTFSSESWNDVMVQRLGTRLVSFLHTPTWHHNTISTKCILREIVSTCSFFLLLGA
jgi:hypothetical protein